MTETKVPPECSPFPEDAELEISISRFNLFRHSIAVILSTCLVAALTMAQVNQFSQSHKFNLISSMTPIYIILILFVLLISVWAVVSVKKIKIDATGIQISNLFWGEKLNWSAFPGLTSAKDIDFALLKGQRSIYLLNKSEFENYQQLESSIEQYLTLKDYC